MLKRRLVAPLAAALAIAPLAADQDHGTDVVRLDHVFVIVMENHAYGQIKDNPYAPFTNQLLRSANAATNYYGIGHPSLTNYLELVGGSNFGVLSDADPDWHNPACVTNLSSGAPNIDDSLHDGAQASGPVCPISGTGVDAATPATDAFNEVDPAAPAGSFLNNIDGQVSVPRSATEGKTIADQLAERHKSWKSYQESVPPSGPDGVNYSDGFYSNRDTLATLPAGWSKSDIIKLYAAKHNPFVYFRAVQEATDGQNGLGNVAGFDGAHGLYADLLTGRVPDFSLIAPNQCNDQHGRGNGGPACGYDPSSTGTQAGLNPALIYQGDATLRTIVTAIHASPAWSRGHNAIVVVWDENDYSYAPNVNHVLTIVDTSNGPHGLQSSRFYTHFSLLKTIEAALDLPCLNHACDSNVPLMSDLFGAR